MAVRRRFLGLSPLDPAGSPPRVAPNRFLGLSPLDPVRSPPRAALNRFLGLSPLDPVGSPPRAALNAEEPLIDSINAEKAIAKERKKGNKEKKHRTEKSKEHKGNSKHEHSHKKRKYDDRDELGGQDECSKELRKHVLDQLEQSSVTEENWLTCPNLNPYDSSDSTQDISKRRKISASVLTHSGSGLIFRIKPPQQETRDPGRHSGSGLIIRIKPPQQKITSQSQSSNPGRTLDNEQLQLKGKSPLIPGRNLGLPASNNQPCVSGKIVAQKNTVVERPITSSQPQSSISGRSVDKQQPLLKRKSALIHDNRNPELPFSNKSLCDSGRVAGIPPFQKPATSTQPQLQQKVRPSTHDIKDSVLATFNKLPCVLTSVMVRPLVLQQDNVLKPPAYVEQPCFFGRAVEEAAAAEAAGGKPHLEHKRRSRTEDIKKQHKRRSRTEDIKKQHEDLIVNWTPPALSELSDSGDQEWLWATKRNSKCVGSSPYILDRGSTVLPLQPLAQYLPEFNMYALPYVIPF